MSQPTQDHPRPTARSLSATPQRRQRRYRNTALAAAGVLLAAGLSSCSGGSDKTTLTFFQFKGEAAQYFRDLAEEFERQNPDIRIVVDTPADPETALRTRFVKDQVPDVMTLNANGTFGEFASANIFQDFADNPVLADVNPAYIDVIGNLGAGGEGEVNGVPFAANASGLLYNQEIFEQYDVAVPRTWDELIEAAQTFQENDVTPFRAMLADNWTPQSPLAPLSAQLQPENFFEERFQDETTFSEGWRSTAEQLKELYEYTQPDPLAGGYEDGTAAFARGESAMLPLGSYAVPQIRLGDPDFTVASMALPATDDPAKTTLVSGVDVVITADRDGEHPEEAQRFIEFLMQPEVMTGYCEAQVAIPTIEGLTNEDPALQGVQEYIDAGRIVGFTDHQFIPAIPLGPLLQEFVLDGDTDTFLANLDDSWDKVAQRRTWGLGEVIS
jgi:raffinose/stachyose/melibiose transport system substrate-binding protein